MQEKGASQQQHRTWALDTGVIKDSVAPQRGRVSGENLHSL